MYEILYGPGESMEAIGTQHQDFKPIHRRCDVTVRICKVFMLNFSVRNTFLQG